MRHYEYRHIVSFEETSLVGSVYYANYLKWQGICREMFLKDHVPEIISELKRGFVLATTSVSCKYYKELHAFDTLVLRMKLGTITQNRLTMLFEYVRTNTDEEELVAIGEQEVACMRREGSSLTAVPIPSNLVEALNAFAPR